MRTKLEASLVPITLPSPKNVAAYQAAADELNSALESYDYMPNNSHGYLGYPKKDGCTRFVPVLTVVDTIVYYSIVWRLEDDLIIPTDGIFGAWQTKPEKVLLASQDGASEIDHYSSNTFNKLAWFTQWKDYGALLTSILQDQKFGNFVLTTDIANFYDTIDIGRLCDEIRTKVSSSDRVIDLLRFFLQYWDRRVKGYAPSSKGIPQEIISDASRTLANFYLHEFDVRFKAICAQRGVTYVRWADDIVLIGKSPKALEHTLHEGSRALLARGLNFNASKTHHFTRSSYYSYRGLAVLNVLQSASASALERRVRAFVKFHAVYGGRMDSVFRGVISRLYNSKAHRTPYLLNFVLDKADDFYHVGLLDERQMFRFCALSPKPSDALASLARLLSRYPYTSARATLLESIRKRRKDYVKLGVSVKRMQGIGKQLLDMSKDSELLSDICAPAFQTALA